MTDDEIAYSVGLVVQVIDEAGSEGITLGELASKTQLDPETLATILAVALAAGHVTRVERYYPRA